MLIMYYVANMQNTGNKGEGGGGYTGGGALTVLYGKCFESKRDIYRGYRKSKGNKLGSDMHNS